jgi:hypothetical protein
MKKNNLQMVLFIVLPAIVFAWNLYLMIVKGWLNNQFIFTRILLIVLCLIIIGFSVKRNRKIKHEENSHTRA